MVLGADRIIQLVQNGVEVETPEGQKAVKPLVDGLSESQIDGIEGTTVDLRVGAFYKPVSGAELLCESRVTPKVACVADIERGDKIYAIRPNEYLLAQTIETVNLPDSLFAYLSERTTMFRSGLYLATTFISPNYQGKLTCAVKNLSEYPVDIELGFRILVCAFYEIAGKAVPYRGVWQGERVSTDGEVERPF
jgi:deoxycytidine triphosphate deaminase